MHRVFSSHRKKFASSRTLQFHRAYSWDSGEVVTPFMQVGNQPTKNFATLGPSELQPPFIGAYGQNKKFFPLTLQHRAGVSPYTSFFNLAETYVFSKQSLPPILCYLIKRPPLSRSYGVILPNSLTIIHSNTLMYYICIPASV